MLSSGLVFAAETGRALPYRFLLVVGDQWKDETSALIDRAGDFQLVAALLKSWGAQVEFMHGREYAAYLHISSREASNWAWGRRVSPAKNGGPRSLLCFAVRRIVTVR